MGLIISRRWRGSHSAFPIDRAPGLAGPSEPLILDEVRSTMVPLQNFATGVLAEVIRRQPASPARTAFAWQIAVGPALARSTSVELENGILTVRARDARWTPEIARAADTILARLQHLLGPAAVRELAIGNRGSGIGDR